MTVEKMMEKPNRVADLARELHFKVKDLRKQKLNKKNFAMEKNKLEKEWWETVKKIML